MQPESPQQIPVQQVTPAVPQQQAPQPVGTPTVMSGTLPMSPMSGSVKSQRHIPKLVKIVLAVIAVIVVLGGVLFVVVGKATKGAQVVSDKFVNAIQAGDIEGAYALTSGSFKKVTSQDQLKSVIDGVGPLLQGDEKITGRNIAKATNAKETVELVYKLKNSTADEYMKTQLQKDDGEWRIVNFQADDKPIDFLK